LFDFIVGDTMDPPDWLTTPLILLGASVGALLTFLAVTQSVRVGAGIIASFPGAAVGAILGFLLPVAVRWLLMIAAGLLIWGIIFTVWNIG
jgi:alpha-beta hydrolase superfamily lysophospholipase